MNRLLSVLAATAIAVPSVLVAAAPADARPTTGSAVVAESDCGADEGAWKRYRRFSNMMLCEAVGAAGILMGRWTDWRCDDQNVLWVSGAEEPLGG
ncbi:hypothetical protein [Lentzea albidocapillata]|nr:hypothetical protein [Lentzea albidocapillata]